MREMGLIPGLETFPGEGLGNPLQYSCLENPHGQRSLEGYSPWDHKESDMTEQLSTAQHIIFSSGNSASALTTQLGLKLETIAAHKPIQY